MKPYYDADGITIYHGDCREVVQDLGPAAADLLVTDPPFFIPAQIGQSRTAWPRSIGNLAVMDGYFREALGISSRALSPRGGGLRVQ